MKYAYQNSATEWALPTAKRYEDPFNQVQVDVVFEAPDGRELRVPAFWSGEQTWRVRFASPQVGTHRYRLQCSDETNADLNDQEGILEVKPYEGDNPVLVHGPIRVAADRRHLEHLDGTPFFWLGDTWWMSLCDRFRWPGDFRALTADRVSKGFSVIHLVAGLYPDMPPFDRRGANEAGFPWEEDYARINPAYFDMADIRIDYLVSSGLVPCVVGCWGYFLPLMGLEKMKLHWRNLVARYGAYPMVWCLAGEASMPFYLSETKEKDALLQRSGWTEMARYVRQIDPYNHPITIHPTSYGHEQVDDPSVLDIDMLQAGHRGHAALRRAVDMTAESLALEPGMPVLMGEANYEGILDSSREEIQRFLFWSCVLSGAAGHGYGANGIWQVNTREQPYGPSPHGTSWGDTPWDEAARYPSPGQLGMGKRLLERLQWWRFQPHPEWVEPHQTEENRHLPYAAGIPGQVRVVFVPGENIFLVAQGQVSVTEIERGVQYRAYYFDPRSGREHDLGAVEPDAGGTYTLPTPPIFQDWVVVLQA